MYATAFCDNRSGELVTLPAVRVDKKDMGRRIAEAREKAGFETQAALWRALLVAMQNSTLQNADDERKRGRNLTAQAVSSWENGEVIPSWENLALLVEVLKTDEEWILFGSKPEDRIENERQYLTRVNEEEMKMLTLYRETSKSGQKTSMKLVQSVREEHPADDASVLKLRRKDDKLKI